MNLKLNFFTKRPPAPAIPVQTSPVGYKTNVVNFQPEIVCLHCMKPFRLGKHPGSGSCLIVRAPAVQ